MDYKQALGGLAAGMAGRGEDMDDMGEMMEGGMGGDMIPCPMCQGAGMVPASMLAGAGVPAVPPRLAARSAMSPEQMMAGGPMPTAPRMSMGA